MTNKFNKSSFTAMCRAFGCYDKPFTVEFYNSYMELTEKKETDYNGNAKFTIPRSGEYVVKAISDELSPKEMYSWISIDEKKNCGKYFIFNQIESPKVIVHATLKLEDSNYCGLLISQGEITLWPVLIQ